MAERQLEDWISSYLEYVDNSEPAHMFKLWSAIIAISSCLKRKCFLDWGMFTLYPNLYVVLVGPSGCRKGTAMGPAFDLMNTLNIRMSAESTTRESLIRELNRSSDSHICHTTGAMQMHSSLTIFAQELTVFIGFGKMDLISDLTDWYDCRPRWRYQTKNEELADDIINVWVTLFGATTPALIQTALPPDAIGLGLTSRIIFVFERKKGKSCPAPFLSQEQIALKPKLLHDLEQILMLSGQFRFSSEAFEAYTDWYIRQETNRPFNDERLGGYMERRPMHLLKLCMIMSASRSNSMHIILEDLERALEILTATEKKMPLVYSGVGRSPLAATTEQILRIISIRKTVEYSTLLRMFSHDIGEFELSRILKSLEAMKSIRCTTNGTNAGMVIEFIDKNAIVEDDCCVINEPGCN